MHTSRPRGRGRLVAAIVVSLYLHTLAGLGWLYAPPGGAAGGQAPDDTVDGPDDGVTTIVLRDRSPDRPQPVALPQPEPVTAVPDPLPRTVVEPPTPGVGAVAPVGGSPAAPSNLPKSLGSRPLHGKKAGRTVVYVLDRSSSMGPDRLLRRAVDAIRASLEELGPDARFQIVAYNGGTSMPMPRPLAATAAARDRAGDWMASLTAEGRSDHKAALLEALSLRPDEVYLLTDADDLLETDVRFVPPGARVRISAAVFGGNRPATGTPLERLAERTGGKVEYVGP